jgi:integrase
VFTAEDGSTVHPSSFQRRFKTLVRRVGVPLIRLHDVRHTFATLALEAGVHPKVVSEILGHANISMILDRYSHVIPSMQKDATERVAGLIFGGR